ncbi:type IV pilin protein [Aliamphritea ceti]|uniref:type IV pilin protein n=1 Tax=Aliamphritea ceti TaxID=1524258 RepID=UPI002351B515|nr:type IV pilin protein [Aliamphritea ceti]
MFRMKGFTLLELMIVVAIIGIITAIAYPSYQSYLQDTRRADAQGSLLELAQWMEREFTVNGTYQDGGGNPTLPFVTSPKNGNDTFYSLTVAASAASFVLTATTSGAQQGDRCGAMTLANTGAKGAAVNDCW